MASSTASDCLGSGTDKTYSPHDGATPLANLAKNTNTTGSDPKTKSADNRHAIVQQLAREFSRSSSLCAVSKPLFGSNDPDSPLNPTGNKFNAHSWAKNVARATEEQGQGSRQVGLCFQDLDVFGYSKPADFQKTVASVWLATPVMVARRLLTKSGASAQTRVDILRQIDGLIRPGEMCAVLSRPGGGCSTFLKAISGDRNGIYIDEHSYINYHGISDKDMHSAHRGDVIYTAENDVHFPSLTVNETLTFAARVRCQREMPQGISRNE